ncbi:F-box protein 22 [Microdochium nivale]|nr:F-box protein 22 [Microdochium nivale]
MADEELSDMGSPAPSQAAAVAARRVLLEIPELLEIVLSLLAAAAPRDALANATRVCRTWSAVINASQSVQELLFFLPVRTNIDPVTSRWQGMSANPILQSVFPVRLMTNTRSRLRSSLPRSLEEGEGAVQGSREQQQQRTPRATTFRDSGLQRYLRMVSREKPFWATEDRFSRPDASWRRMLVCQPVSTPAISTDRATVLSSQHDHSTPEETQAQSPSSSEPQNLPRPTATLSYAAFEHHVQSLRAGHVYDLAKMTMAAAAAIQRRNGSSEPYGIRLEWRLANSSLYLCMDGRELQSRSFSRLVDFSG